METNRYRHERVLYGLEHAWRVLRDYVPPAEAADLILTLFFWLYHSREWSAERARLYKFYRKSSFLPINIPNAGADAEAERAANRGKFCFVAGSHWPTTPERKGQDGNTVFLALEAFCAAQRSPDLMRTMLRPARFANGSGHFAKGDQTPLLAEVLHRLEQIDFGFCRTEAPLNIPLLFAAAYQTVQADGPLPMHATLSLMAQLLAPCIGESVLDASGTSGQALAACIRVNGTLNRLQLHLTSHAGASAQLALAHMLLLTHQHHQFTPAALPPGAAVPSGPSQPTDMIVLDQVMASAASPAPDMLRALALAAHQLHPKKGRMALAVTAQWLRHAASLPLRTQLVQRGWLDAVCWLPQQSAEATAVLLLRPGQQCRTVRVLAHEVPGAPVEWSETRGQPGVHQLIWAYQYALQGGRPPWLHEREAAALVQQQYRLDGGKDGHAAA